MRATHLYGAGDVRVEDVPDSVIKQRTDALVRVTASCICGSDLWPYGSRSADDAPARMGDEVIGVVEDTGSEVTTVKRGDLVVSPFAVSDGTCDFCHEGLHTSCAHGAFWDGIPDEGAQAEAVRVPFADGTLVKLPVAADSALIPSLVTLSDVFGTGYHAAVAGSVNERTRVAVIGDGAVGLMAVLSAKRLGAEQIILMGRHPARTDLGREFGATDIVAARGEEGITKVRELTGRHGVHAVLEALGHMPAYEQAFGIVRPGGVISRVGVPQYEDAPVGFGSLFGPNIRLAGGPAPVRAYVEELMPDVLDGSIEPGKVFDASTDIDGVPAGYQDMDDRKRLKVLIKPDPGAPNGDGTRPVRIPAQTSWTSALDRFQGVPSGVERDLVGLVPGGDLADLDLNAQPAKFCVESTTQVSGHAVADRRQQLRKVYVLAHRDLEVQVRLCGGTAQQRRGIQHVGKGLDLRFNRIGEHARRAAGQPGHRVVVEAEWLGLVGAGYLGPQPGSREQGEEHSDDSGSDRCP